MTTQTDNQTPVLTPGTPPPNQGLPLGPIQTPPEDRMRRLTRLSLWIIGGALAGSISIHLMVMSFIWVWAKLHPVEVKPAERFVEIDLRNYKPEKKPETKMVVRPKIINPVPPKQVAVRPRLEETPPPPQAEPTPPQVAPTPERVRIAARPTEPPQVKPEATKPPELKQPEPQPTPEQEKAKPTPPEQTLPKPTPEQADKPKPPKPVVPETIPEPGRRASGQSSPGRGNDSTRLDPNKKPERYAGLLPNAKPGDGAPKGPGRFRPDEQAGDAPGDRNPGRSIGRPQPNTRPRNSDGLSDAGVNANANGGEGDRPQVPLPRGVRNGKRYAANIGDEANDFSTNKSRSLPGGGRTGMGQVDRGGGSPRGRNDELAGTDGGGNQRLAMGIPRRGGGGGTMDSILTTDRRALNDQLEAASGPAGRGPGRGGGQGGGRGGGAGSDDGPGLGWANRGPSRAALNTVPGSGIGAGQGNGIGGPRGGGRGGEMAGDGGSGNGQGGGRGDGIGGGSGGSGGRGKRYARGGNRYGDPFGAPIGGNPNGGGGTGGGPGGPGRGTRLARRGGNGPGDGEGNGAGAGNGGDGNGFGRGKGRGAGGLGIGPGIGGGKGSGDGTGPGIGGGNGSGGKGRGNGGRGNTGEFAGSGDGDGSIGGRGTGKRRGSGPVRLASRGDAGAIIGRGLMRNNGEGGIDGYYFEDADLVDRHYETKVFEMEQSGRWEDIPIDWKTFTRQKHHRVDKVIDFNWRGEAPAPGVRDSFFSVRWVGKIFVPKDDNYRFEFENVDDGGRLYLNGEKIIDIWKVQKSSPKTPRSYRLTRGPHKIVIEYVQGPPTESSITLRWMSSSFPWETVGAYIPGD